MFWWIQVPLSYALKLEEDDKIPKNTGYQYTKSTTGKEMVEYHVNSCKLFQEAMYNESNFGGKLSVRMEKGTKPIEIFGHNKCIFKQFTLTKKAWVGHNSEIAISCQKMRGSVS